MRCYCVTVHGWGSSLYHAESAGGAKYAAFLSDAFSHMTFFEFIKIAHAKLAKPTSDGYARLRLQYPTACIPEPGARIKAEGFTGTVLPALRLTSYVVFQPDGQKSREALVHPLSVSLLTAEAVE